MKRFVYVLGVVILFVSNAAQADSVSFSTDFTGTTIDSNLVANGPAGTLEALDGNGHLKLFTSPDGTARDSDIWDASVNAPRVTYGVDSTDTRDFTMEATLANWAQSGGKSQAGILFVFSNTTLMCGVATDSTSGNSIVSQSGQLTNPSWGLADVALSSISGDNVNVGLKAVRSGSAYLFSYKLGNTGNWQTLTTNTISGDLQSVGLYVKTYGGASISNATFDSMSFSVVPEPSSVVLLSMGLLSLVAYAWRKRK